MKGNERKKRKKEGGGVTWLQKSSPAVSSMRSRKRCAPVPYASSVLHMYSAIRELSTAERVAAGRSIR
eukprot:3378392-Rhodomonas_salina.1